MSQPLRIVIDHAAEDDCHCEELSKQLTPLVREDRISLWSTLSVEPGSDREAERTQHLDYAEVVLLLISPDYLASEACLAIALDRLPQGLPMPKSPRTPKPRSPPCSFCGPSKPEG